MSVEMVVDDIEHLIEDSRAIRDERVGVVGGHVDAKRYLTATNAQYMERLSAAMGRASRVIGGC